MPDYIAWENGDLIDWEGGDNIVWESPAGYWVDSFSRSDAADLGVNWRDITNGHKIVSNTAVPRSSGVCTTVYNALNDHVQRGPDASAKADIYKASVTGGYHGLYLRWHRTDGGEQGYLALVQTVNASSNTADYSLWKVVNSVGTQLGSTISGETWTDGTQLQLQAIGNAIKVFKAGVEKISVTDNTFNNISGQAAIRSTNTADGGFKNWSVSAEGINVLWSMNGFVTPTTARVVVGVSEAANVSIDYSTNSDMSGYSTTANTAVTSSSNFIAGITISGLTAGTTYYRRIRVNDSIREYGTFKKFKTAPTAGSSGIYRIAVTSCARLFDRFEDSTPSSLDEDSTVFTHIIARDPHLFIFNGDIGYADERENGGSQTVAHFRERYRHILQPWTRTLALSNLINSVPSIFNFDNHEFKDGVYDADSAQAWGEHFGLANPTTYANEYYYAQEIGDVGIFVTDGQRYESAHGASDVSGKTKLGATQLGRLQTWFTESSTRRIKIYVSPTSLDPWSQSFSVGRAFGTSYTYELRTDIWQHCQTNNVSGMFGISGDNHWYGLFKTTWNSRNNYNWSVGPGNNFNISLPSGASSHADTIYAGDTIRQVFGLLTIDTTLAVPTVKAEIIDDTNTIRFTHTMTLTDLDNGLTLGSFKSSFASISTLIALP